MEYDRAVSSFVTRVLDPAGNHEFWDDFGGFQRRIADLGMFNSLSQTVLRITSPGVPDTYQGTEMWDFSLVDPDNRRPVDYTARRRILQELQSALSRGGDLKRLVRELLNSREDGRIKMYVTFRALHCRRDNAGLFSKGTYVPLKTRGEKAEHLFCFARALADRCALVAVPRFFTRLTSNTREAPVGRGVWGATTILTEGLPERIQWRNVFTEAEIEERTDGSGVLRAANLFADLPVALLIGRVS
jgi:(1->4)-alpha-D-glucan 1-alpha-D-glucosylmutase